MSLLGREYLSVPVSSPVPDDPRDLDAFGPPAGPRSPARPGGPRRPDALVTAEPCLVD